MRSFSTKSLCWCWN